MTKEDVKNFLLENKKGIALIAGLTVSGIATFAIVCRAYYEGYWRGVKNVSNNVQKLLGYEKYEQLRVALDHMFESK